MKSYYTSRVILSFLRSVIETPFVVSLFIEPYIIRFKNPSHFLYFPTAETIVEAILEQTYKLSNRQKVEHKLEYKIGFHYVDKNGNKIPPEIRFPEVTKVMENGTKISFFDTTNPKKVHELESELYRLQKKAGISSIRRMRPGETLGIMSAIDRMSTPGPTKAQLDFFSLRDELERPEDYSVNIVTRYCGLKVEPKEGVKLEEIYTKEIECPHEEGYCEKCEITKNLKDKFQKQNK